ncbi:phosphatase PAP2 family protein, partial [Candidatus Dojkabacteria bacterium]|nr:phosphatase PAP2 family protein [Candidatus Dojkabacteria bacterium]
MELKPKSFLKKEYLIVIFIVLLLIIPKLSGFYFGMDLILVVLLVAALLLKDGKKFLLEWSIPVILFYLYEILRGYSDNIAEYLGRPLIIEPIINLETHLFFFLSDVPTVVLQNLLHPQLGVIHWYDYLLAFVYSSFFWFWMAVGFVIWKKRHKYFRPYIFGLMVISFFSALLFFIPFPTSPPWWASENGYLPQVERVMWVTLEGNSEVTLINAYGRNDFAAIPSLHFTWPFFASLMLVLAFPDKKYLKLIFIVPFLIAFATWYGAEHYVVDS